MRMCLAFLMMVLGPAVLFGQQPRGSGFVEQCKAVDQVLASATDDVALHENAALCLGYLRGFVTSAQAYGVRLSALPAALRLKISEEDMNLMRDAVFGFCLPPNQISTDQVRKVFLKYMDDHPERLHEPVEVLLFAALQKAFPCHKESNAAAERKDR